MGDKKITYKIDTINMEIDYDKLADAIVKAQEKANRTKEEPTQKNIFKAIWLILKGQKSKDGRYLSAPYVILVSALYRLISLFGFMCLGFFVYGAIVFFANDSWQGLSIASNIVMIVVALLLAFAFFLYMVMFWGAANDIEQENDKNYVISVFSGLVSIASLVVAILALRQ